MTVMSMDGQGYFNSQPHKEADNTERRNNSGKNISTHSLTRRLTILMLKYLAAPRYFNSQPHKEADPTRAVGRTGINISTHSLTRRLTAISDKNIFIQN